jgi:hypothetical protein
MFEGEFCGMVIANEADIIKLVSEDIWMMDLLITAQTLQLPDWWICAGFVRSKLWDDIHGFSERTPLPDIDLIFFNPTLIDEAVEKELENRLKLTHPHIPWSVKNEARMHKLNNLLPYTSSVDAISKFPETATALGLMLDEHNQVKLAAPCGIQDVINLILKPTAFFSAAPERIAIYESRLISKNWQAKWPRIRSSV